MVRIYSAEKHRQDLRRERVRAIMRDLVLSVVIRITEELEADPGIDSFDTPLLIDQRAKMGFSRALLGRHPEAVSRKISPRIGREVVLRLDESTEPPILTIELGKDIPPKIK